MSARKYTVAQREAMYRLYVEGNGAAEIARRCAAGTAGVRAFEIPRRTVYGIVTTAARGNRDPVSDNPTDNQQSLEERLRGLIQREITRQEAKQTSGEDLNSRKLQELASGLRQLRPTKGVAGRAAPQPEASKNRVDNSILAQLAAQAGTRDEGPPSPESPSGKGDHA